MSIYCQEHGLALPSCPPCRQAWAVREAAQGIPMHFAPVVEDPPSGEGPGA